MDVRARRLVWLAKLRRKRGIGSLEGYLFEHLVARLLVGGVLTGRVRVRRVLRTVRRGVLLEHGLEDVRFWVGEEVELGVALLDDKVGVVPVVVLQHLLEHLLHLLLSLELVWEHVGAFVAFDVKEAAPAARRRTVDDVLEDAAHSCVCVGGRGGS